MDTNFKLHVCCLQVKTLSLFVSIGWCVYNSIPPYLLLHYWAWGHKGLRWTSTIASLVSTLVAIFIIIMIWLVLPNSYDFGKVGVQLRAPVFLFLVSKPGLRLFSLVHAACDTHLTL